MYCSIVLIVFNRTSYITHCDTLCYPLTENVNTFCGCTCYNVTYCWFNYVLVYYFCSTDTCTCISAIIAFLKSSIIAGHIHMIHSHTHRHVHTCISSLLPLLMRQVPTNTMCVHKLCTCVCCYC